MKVQKRINSPITVIDSIVNSTCRNALLNCSATECEEVVCPSGMEAVDQISYIDGQCQRPMCPLHYSVRYNCAEKILSSSRSCYCPVGSVESHVSRETSVIILLMVRCSTAIAW